MQRKTIIGIALAVYLVIVVAGGVAYYVVSQVPEATPGSSAVEMAPQPDPAAAQAHEAERQQRAAREARIAELERDMRVETVNGTTFYTYDIGKPSELSSGLHLNVFIARGSRGLHLMGDIIYRYTIEDPEQTAWIKGDQLELSAGGQRTTIELREDREQRSMASDASALTERSQFELDAAAEQVVRAMAQSGSGSILYYRTGGKSRGQSLTSADTARIANMIELYGLLAADED